jgi:hypothetical protein
MRLKLPHENLCRRDKDCIFEQRLSDTFSETQKQRG